MLYESWHLLKNVEVGGVTYLVIGDYEAHYDLDECIEHTYYQNLNTEEQGIVGEIKDNNLYAEFYEVMRDTIEEYIT